MAGVAQKERNERKQEVEENGVKEACYGLDRKGKTSDSEVGRKRAQIPW